MLSLLLLSLAQPGCAADKTGPAAVDEGDSAVPSDSAGEDSAPGVDEGDDSATDDSATAGTPDDTGTAEERPPVSFAGAAPKNILVVAWDTTRPDLFGHYTGADTTPRLDALLEGAMVLEDHRSCSNWTYASMICVQTGARDVVGGFVPSTTGVTPVVPEDTLLVSEALRDMGFQTVLAGDQPFFSPENEMARGFDQAEVDRSWTADQVTDSALGMMATLDPSEPFYAHVHHLDAHTPYDPPEAYLGALEGLAPIPYNLSLSATYTGLQNEFRSLDPETQALIREHIQVRYLAGLRYLDDELGRLLDGMESMGLLEDTLILFLTDHGEQLLENGDIGHAYNLYDYENRAITAFNADGLTPGSWAGPTSHSDIWPTVFDAMGWEAPREFSGRPVGQRGDDTLRYAMRHQGARTFQSIERAGVKMIYWWEDGAKNLYRLDEDPDEVDDVYDAEDPDVVEFWELLLPEIDRVLAIHPGDTPVDPGP